MNKLRSVQAQKLLYLLNMFVINVLLQMDYLWVAIKLTAYCGRWLDASSNHMSNKVGNKINPTKVIIKPR